ncbi:hypothetical protein PV05_10382 [Exophiala xenobiotica]|uniref:Mid2 domain-containing protein n=1 Tax=Exophiala xenobiotica TaxID=348802 RepID=A0A0D2E8C5_9EURO|nr:uncharacterized protein PV05_10382 [Exophiala xenobiotica]KIW51683.1 hypothetical protein PV05_10382 [Exophiala xenobiotica]
MLSLRIHSLLLWAAFRDVLAQDDEFQGKIDCYGWTGQVFSNNTQCSGSRICCQTADLCDPNRFCVQNGQHVVPACAVFPWSECSNICQYEPGTGFLPRAVECDDGSFCCDNDPSCCSEDRGIVLNGLGAIVSTHSPTPSTTSSTSTTAPLSTTSLSSPSLTQTTPTSTATQAGDSSGSAPTSSSGLSTAAKAGIGIAVAVTAILIMTLAALLVRYRRRLGRQANTSQPLIPQILSNKSQSYPQSALPYSDQLSRPSELEGIKPKTGSEVHELPGRQIL